MKRSMGGGSARGPVAHGRQRRTIRLMQAVLGICGVALLAYAGVAAVSLAGYEPGNSVDATARPGIMQPVALVVGGVIALVAAALLGGRSGVNLPTPARLDELVGRAEKAAVGRAETAAARSIESDPVDDTGASKLSD